MFDSVPAGAGAVRQGLLRPLAVTTPARIAAYPDLPTTAEAGFPGLVISTWYGIWAPPRMPMAIAERMQRAVAVAVQDSDVKARLATLGADPVADTPADFAAYQKSEQERWFFDELEASQERGARWRLVGQQVMVAQLRNPAANEPCALNVDGWDGYAASRERHRARNTLLVAQVALALVLLVAAGLMVRTFEQLRNVDPGIRSPEQIQVLRLSFPRQPASGVSMPRMQSTVEERLARTGMD